MFCNIFGPNKYFSPLSGPPAPAAPDHRGGAALGAGLQDAGHQDLLQDSHRHQQKSKTRDKPAAAPGQSSVAMQ